MRAKLDTAISVVILGYFVYASITDDKDLIKLRQHARYRWWKLTRLFKESSDPAWKNELREFNKEDGELRSHSIELPAWDAVEP